MDILPLLLFFICQLVNLTKLWSTLTSFLFESLLFTEKNLGNLASPVPTAHPLTTVPAHCYTQRIRLLYRHLLLSGPKYCFLRFASKAVTQGFPSRSAPSLNNLHVLSKQGPLALTSFSLKQPFLFLTHWLQFVFAYFTCVLGILEGAESFIHLCLSESIYYNTMPRTLTTLNRIGYRRV